ncbi:FAD-linked oxidoreductase [Teratosphaeria destructans]|uniref:FAD-linked oxidoreductase n=1 Tax=Teratosphaeria destructans TaxID=418781 RepID=A0A9W7W4Q7_9PEZI|nr:FAD-linked oxidoreductase [Teratosphaeria destructans]
MAPATKRSVASDIHISQLRELLRGTAAQVLTPADSGYGATLLRWSRAAEKPAGVSIVPTTAEQISVALKFATDNGIDVAVKGGGHSTAGASSTEGGMLIDLGRMRAVHVDPEKQQLHVQGGALWGDVDEAGYRHGLATVGGTVADTGVGGLTLGGGYGALSGQYGLVIDNVVSQTVVLADGEIVTASREKNSDLFWALLGAGQNFGVTTEFVFQAYPQQDIYMGTLVFLPTPENVKKLVKAVNEIYAVPSTGGRSKSQGKSGGLLGFGKPPDAGGNSVLLFLASYFGTEQEGRELFKPLLDVGPIVNTLAMGPYPQVNKMVPAIIGMRSSMKGAAFVMPIREKFLSQQLAEFDRFTEETPDAATTMVAWELYDPSVVVQKDNGSFANRGYHLNSLIMPMWSDPANDQQCRQWARERSLDFKKELEVHGMPTSKGIEGGASVRGHKGGVLLYGNYDQYDEISKDIFGDSYERLQALKAEYDPTNVFNKLFPITPAAGANGHAYSGAHGSRLNASGN